MNFKSLLIAVLLLCGAGSFTPGQTLEAKLAAKVDSFDSSAKSIPLQLVEVAQRFNVPMGIEWLDSSPAEAAVPLQLRDTTVGGLLAQILAQQPGYQFRLDDGVVHVFVEPLADDQCNFLNIRLREFSLEKASMPEARFRLWGAIISQLHPRGGYGGGWGGESMYKDFDVPKISFVGQNLTVRQALNRIVVAQGNALWVVRIRAREMMEGEPFYVQIPGPSEAGEPAKSFAWQFIALDVHRLE